MFWVGLRFLIKYLVVKNVSSPLPSAYPGGSLRAGGVSPAQGPWYPKTRGRERWYCFALKDRRQPPP